jgi:hypothetical protein
MRLGSLGVARVATAALVTPPSPMTATAAGDTGAATSGTDTVPSEVTQFP